MAPAIAAPVFLHQLLWHQLLRFGLLRFGHPPSPLHPAFAGFARRFPSGGHYRLPQLLASRQALWPPFRIR